MNILMMSNTYTPLAGGLERSLKSFAAAYRRRGHRVLLVAPVFDRMPRREAGVLRVAAIPRIGGSVFSARLPVPGLLTHVSELFKPDIIHAHHPFLMGDTALRIASLRQVPVVFTHHVLFEQYTRCLRPLRTNVAQRFVIDLATGFANLCDQVFAPSQSVADLLQQRGVTAPIEVVPTGVDLARFKGGNRARLRAAAGLPDEAFVVGHLGRLDPEKNLHFLASAVVSFLREEPRGWFVVGGEGPGEAMIRQACEEAGVGGRLRMLGPLQGHWLADAYHVMDVFVFASQSETQGLVLVEAMSAGVPVVAVDAPGVRDVVIDGHNGRLLPKEDAAAFAGALHGMCASASGAPNRMRRGAAETAKHLSMTLCADRALKIYAGLIAGGVPARPADAGRWARTKRSWRMEARIARKTMHAVRALLEEACAREPVYDAGWGTGRAGRPGRAVSGAANAGSVAGVPCGSRMFVAKPARPSARMIR